MGTIHNELRKGQISVAVKNFLGVEASEDGVERFSETLSLSLDLFKLPELSLQRGENIMARQVLTAVAPAGRFPVVLLRNLTGSGILAVLEGINCSSPVDIALETGDSSAAVANPVAFQGVPCDSRFPRIGEVSQLLGLTGDVAAGAANPQFGGAFLVQLNPRFVMAPNSQLFVIGQTAAASIRVSLTWRERNAFHAEIE